MGSTSSADLAFEYELRAQGCRYIAGIDEAGRGPLAGPVLAAAVILPLDRDDLAGALAGVNDSKQLTAGRRERLFDVICRTAVAVGVGAGSHAQIDAEGVRPATHAAMRRAVAALATPPTHLLIDYEPLPEIGLPFTAIKFGDARSLSIAAASIVAKVLRDRLMCELHELYPQYGFDAHKGYDTARHRAALCEFGPCPIHRRRFKTVYRLDQLSIWGTRKVDREDSSCRAR
ncbi:MAG: ribonuclease HII [Anaerolineae bacterium]|nr:ribonuclease HII [Anaerolineae bacterium]